MTAPKRPTARKRAYLPAAERRQSILAAAREVFSRSNLQGARTRDIAAAAAVNQATVFEHFASKEALFEAAVVQPLIDAMRGMHERMAGYVDAGTPDELALRANASSQRHIADMMDIFPLMTAALFSEPESGRALYSEHIAPLIRERGRVLDGLLREGLNPDFVGLAIFGILFAIAMDQHFGQGEGAAESDLAELTRQFTRMSTGGFARDKRAR